MLQNRALDIGHLALSYIYIAVTAAVAQWVRVFDPQAEGWVSESQQRQTQVVKTGRDSSTAKHSAIGMSVTGPRR